MYKTKQQTKPANTVVEGENLDLLIGSQPLEGTEKEAVKAMTLKLLNDKYGIEEEDFLSAELEIVPAGKARELGMDASMILAYGQDDRVCAYTSLVAMLEVEAPEKTSCCLLVDKEEIGSVGATGMQSHFFENTMAELLALAGEGTELALRRCLASSRMLSSDVSAAFDPLYAAAFEKKNAAFFGKGIVINKFTGAGGKSGFARGAGDITERSVRAANGVAAMGMHRSRATKLAGYAARYQPAGGKTTVADAGCACG